MASRHQLAAARESFEHAVAQAAERRALLFELRASTSLTRVLPAPPAGRLADLVDRFDGADCPDMRAARTLIHARGGAAT